MNTEYIFAKPKYIEGVGNIYPVKLKDWDEFEKHSNILLYSKKHLIKNFSDFNLDEVKLLPLLAMAIPEDKLINDLTEIFKIVLRKDTVEFVMIGDYFWFQIDEFNSITTENYEVVREVIMKQNLIPEPKVYKDPLMQQWAEKALQAKQKEAINCTIEDMITTVSVINGTTYDKLEDYSMYQLSASFNRISKIKEFETQVLQLSNPYADSSKMKLSHFAEKVDLFKSPYDDLFKDKNKLNITKVMKDG